MPSASLQLSLLGGEGGKKCEKRLVEKVMRGEEWACHIWPILVHPPHRLWHMEPDRLAEKEGGQQQQQKSPPLV